MNPRLCILLLFLSATTVCAPGRAAVAPAFLAVGKYYKVIAPTGTPLPGSDLANGAPAGGGNTTTIRILKVTEHQWCWAEYDADQLPPSGQPGPVVITKKRVWFNFAQATLIEEVSAPDYATLFPHGFKIVRLW